MRRFSLTPVQEVNKKSHFAIAGCIIAFINKCMLLFEYTILISLKRPENVHTRDISLSRLVFSLGLFHLVVSET